MARASKVLPGLIVNESLPEVGQAASMALTLMAAAGADTWSHLVADDEAGLALRQKIAAKLTITEDQAELLDEWSTEMTWLSKAKPAITIAVCAVCEEMVVVASAAPTACRVTPDCEGVPKRISAATRTKV